MILGYDLPIHHAQRVRVATLEVVDIREERWMTKATLWILLSSRSQFSGRRPRGCVSWPVLGGAG
jgi:hypothetical protein